jgi:hypothetical protein
MLKAMLGEAWQAMGANRMRTVLTMLGMVIGVGSVVLMMAIGQGAQYSVAQTISTMGSNLYILISGSTSAGGLRSGGRRRPDADRRRCRGDRRTRRRGQRGAGAAGHAATGLWREQLERDGGRHDAALSRCARVDDRQRLPLRRFGRALGDARGADRPDRGRQSVRRRRSAGQDDPHPPESFRDHRRARQERTEPRRTRPGRYPDHSADHRPAQGFRQRPLPARCA